MITKKEDLINTYIENDYGELRDLYIEAMNIFGIRGSVNGRFDYLLEGERKYIACMTEFCRNGQSEWSSNYCDVRALKKLTISDLKPRTRTEYEKVTESIFDLRDEFERGELYFKYSQGIEVIKTEQMLLAQIERDGVHRKVEKEIDERQEFIDNAYYLAQSCGAYDVEEVAGIMYDAGCRFQD